MTDPQSIRRHWPLLVLLIILMLLTRSHALTYGEWIAGYPSLTGDAALATADPDGDGAVNLMEYALAGMDPTVPMAGAAMLPKAYFCLRAEDGSYSEPTTSPPSTAAVAAAASMHIVLRYQPREGVTDVLYVPKTNQEDLRHWGWGDSAIYEWDADGYRWARTISDMKVWSERAFMCLRVEIIP